MEFGTIDLKDAQAASEPLEKAGKPAIDIRTFGTYSDVLQALADSPAARRHRLSDTATALTSLISGSDEALRIQAVRLAGLWKVEPLAGSSTTSCTLLR